MDGLMMDYQLNVPAILRRADELYGDHEIASRLPDKSWHRYSYADFVSRTKKLIVALRTDLARGPGRYLYGDRRTQAVAIDACTELAMSAAEAGP